MTSVKHNQIHYISRRDKTAASSCVIKVSPENVSLRQLFHTNISLMRPLKRKIEVLFSAELGPVVSNHEIIQYLNVPCTECPYWADAVNEELPGNHVRVAQSGTFGVHISPCNCAAKDKRNQRQCQRELKVQIPKNILITHDEQRARDQENHGKHHHLSN